MANRNLEAQRLELENELRDARTKIELQQKDLSAKERELDALHQTLANLEKQLNGTDEARRAALDALSKMAERGLGEGPTVISQPLPRDLHEAVKQFAAMYPDAVEYDAQRGAVRWKSDLLFALGSAVVRDEAKASLGGFADIVQSQAAAEFEALVVGHTDNKPIKRSQTRVEHKTNWHLSSHRAISVMEVLRGYGVGEPRMGVMGYGEFRPIADNSGGPQNQAKNRRVEIFLVPSNRGATAAGPDAPATDATRATAKAE
jgi:chemotaxis protein MotB